MVHSGIPVDATDLENVAGAVSKGLEQFLSQCLHGLIQRLLILGFMGEKPVPVVIHADAPKKINGFRGEAFKHRIYLIF